MLHFEAHDEVYWNATGDEWEVPMKSVRPTIVVMNAKGQPLDRMVGLQPAMKIVEACSKKAPCCDDPSCAGCGDK